jgi:hypothetical protein
MIGWRPIPSFESWTDQSPSQERQSSLTAPLNVREQLDSFEPWEKTLKVGALTPPRVWSNISQLYA